MYRAIESSAAGYAPCFAGYLLFSVLERCQRIESGCLSPEHRPEPQASSSGDLTPAQTLQSEAEDFYRIDVLAWAWHRFPLFRPARIPQLRHPFQEQ